MKIGKLAVTIFVVCLAAALSACTNAPSREAMKEATVSYQLPQQPEAGKALVYVVRPSGMGSLVRFNVFVDNQEDESEVGYTRGAQYIYFSVAPGPHQIYSKAENWADSAINAKAGDIIYIKQEPSMGVRNSIFKIEEYEGKYYVKTLQLGTLAKTGK